MQYLGNTLINKQPSKLWDDGCLKVATFFSPLSFTNRYKHWTPWMCPKNHWRIFQHFYTEYLGYIHACRLFKGSIYRCFFHSFFFNTNIYIGTSSATHHGCAPGVARRYCNISSQNVWSISMCADCSVS